MIQLDLQSRQPIYEQMLMKVSELIAMGALTPDEQLPSVRTLARDLGVNPNTVQKAYQELERRGIIYSVTGKGSFIASGSNAGDVLRTRSLHKLHDVLEEGKRSGLTQTDAEQAVHTVYVQDSTPHNN